MDPIVPQPAPEPQVPPDHTSPPIWGPGLTILWGVAAAIVFLLAQVLVTFIYLLFRTSDPGSNMDTVLRNLEFDGTYIAFCTFATMLVSVPATIGIVKLKRGSQLKDYLALRWPRLGQVLRWSLITVGFCLLTDAIFLLLRQPTVPEFMLKAYSSASPRWLIWVAVVIAAPIFEEILFRGFLFKGLAASRLRWQGATIITAALWAAIHLQYDWYGISVIFALGLLLGTIRAMTNSTLLTIWLHGLINILATIQTVIALRQL